MPIEPIVFFDLGLAIFILSVVLGPLVISYVKNLQKFQIRQKAKATSDVAAAKFDLEQEDIKSQAREQASLILEDAKEKALKIISDANLFQN